jgi:hypothetical protein
MVMIILLWRFLITQGVRMANYPDSIEKEIDYRYLNELLCTYGWMSIEEAHRHERAVSMGIFDAIVTPGAASPYIISSPWTTGGSGGSGVVGTITWVSSSTSSTMPLNPDAWFKITTDEGGHIDYIKSI